MDARDAGGRRMGARARPALRALGVPRQRVREAGGGGRPRDRSDRGGGADRVRGDGAGRRIAAAFGGGTPKDQLPKPNRFPPPGRGYGAEPKCFSTRRRAISSLTRRKMMPTSKRGLR